MTDKRVVVDWEQLWESLTKIDQDPSTFETPWSRLTVFCHPSIPTLVSPVLSLCTICVVVAQRPKGNTNFRPNWVTDFFMKTLSGVFLGRLKVLLPLSVCRSTNPLNFAKSFRVPIPRLLVYWPVPYHVPCSCMEQLQSGSSSLARLT